MIIKYFALFSLFAVWASSAKAQTSVAIASKPTPIVYSRHLPKSVSRLMPTGAKSLFWGTFTPRKGGKTMAIHLLARHPKAELVICPQPKLSPRRHFALDVFEQRGASFVRINRAPVTFNSSLGWGKILVRARQFWIDPSQRQPLLVLESFTKDGYFADVPFGDAIFLSFVKGWRGGSALQTSNFGASNNDSKYYGIERGPNGLLQIRRDDGSMNIGPDARGNDIRVILLFKWKKRRFVVTPGTAQYLGRQDAQFKP